MKHKPQSTTSHIGATEFKTHCLELLSEVKASKRELVVTKRGKPFVKIVPVRDEKPQLFGFLKGAIEIHGDLTEPTEAEWDALRE